MGGGGGGMPNPGCSSRKRRKRKSSASRWPPTDEPVIEVRVEGNKLIPTPQILNEMQTRVGRPYDPALIQRDVRKLASRSWFVAVEPDIEKTDRGPHRHDQSRRAADDPLHRVPGQRRRVPRPRRHPRQDARQRNRPQGRRLDRSLCGRRSPPQDHRPLPPQRLQQHPSLGARRQQADRQGRRVHHQRRLGAENLESRVRRQRVRHRRPAADADRVEEAADVHLQGLRRPRTNRRRRRPADGLLPRVRLLPGQSRPQARVQRGGQLGHAAIRDQRRPALPGPQRHARRQSDLCQHVARRAA